MSEKIKVLLVEDDFYIRELYQSAMGLKGYEVFTAADGDDAIRLYDEAKPDVVLLDIMLPTKSGMEVLKHVKLVAQEKKPIPVIMITNLDTPEALEEAQRLGADDYWIKSLTPPLKAADNISKYISK